MSPGIDPSTITPPDAAVAIRSYPRRWKGVLALAEDAEDGQEVLRRGSPSVLDILGRSVDELRAAEGWLRSILVGSEPTLGPLAALRGGDVDDLQAAADALASVVEGVPGDDWNRTGVLDGTRVTALDVVRRTVLSVAEDLREGERTLRAQVGRPD